MHCNAFFGLTLSWALFLQSIPAGLFWNGQGKVKIPLICFGFTTLFSTLGFWVDDHRRGEYFVQTGL